MKKMAIARVVVFSFVAMVCFFRLGSSPLNETDEGFAATRADSFARHHSWIVSYDDVGESEPQFRKPPLLYWMVAGFYEICGRTMWSVRLPTAILSFFVGVLIYLITRRYFKEEIALVSAALPFTVPFVVLHVRTAMLDMPLLFFILLSVYAFAFFPRSFGMAGLAGLAGAGAVLLKGEAGVVAAVFALLAGLIRGECRKTWLRRLPLFLFFWIAPIVIYYIALPSEYKNKFIYNFLVKEGIDRIYVFQFDAFCRSIFLNLNGYLAASAGGLLIIIQRSKGDRRIREWLALALLLSVPVVVIGCKQDHVYARYFLPVYPFILTASAVFICEAPCLIRFSSRGWVQATLLVALAAGSFFSPWSRAQFPGKDEAPQSELRGLVEEALALLPPDETLLIGGDRRFKCHTILFYARRPLQNYADWFLSDFAPGQTRYAIWRKKPKVVLPFTTLEIVEQAGPWYLVKITTSSDAKHARGVLLAKKEAMPVVQQTLHQLSVGYEMFESGFILTHIPHCATNMYSESNISIRRDGAIYLTAKDEVLCCGVDIVPSKNDQLSGALAFQRFDGKQWVDAKRVETLVSSDYNVIDGRLYKVNDSHVRLRFEAVMGRQFRIIRTGDQKLDIGSVQVYVEERAGATHE